MLFRRSIPVISILLLDQDASGGAREELRRWPGETRAVLSTQLSLVHVSDSGAVWLLDSANRRIVSQNVGGDRAVVGTVDADAIRKGFCLPDDSTIVTMASGRVSILNFRDVATDGENTAHTLYFRSPVDSAAWAGASLITGPTSACLFVVPAQGQLYAISQDTAFALWKATVRVGPRRTVGWRLALEKVFRKADQMDSLVMIDVASNQRSIAVLVGSKEGSVGREVLFFGAKGGVVASTSIQARALRIAMTATELLALEVRRDSLFLASYALPTGARAPDSPTVRASPSAPERRKGAP